MSSKNKSMEMVKLDSRPLPAPLKFYPNRPAGSVPQIPNIKPAPTGVKLTAAESAIKSTLFPSSKHRTARHRKGRRSTRRNRV